MIPSCLRGQSFTLALAGSIALSLAVPEIGAPGGPLRPEIATKAAVFLIFLMQGLSLPTRQLLRSAADARLHAFCLASNFVLAPALMLALLAVAGSWVPPELRAGFLYLAVLPTTISSAVVMTAHSEGDAASALFATTLSNVVGIAATPLLCLWLLQTPELRMPPLGPLAAQLALLVLLPLTLGQCLRPFGREAIRRSTRWFKRGSNALILFIVFAAFCASAQNELWANLDARTAIAALAGSLAFLGLLSMAVWKASALATRRRAGRIAAFYCGSQKTLATGVPMAALLFAASGDEGVGLLLLPLMAHHPLQLALAGLLSPRFALSQARERAALNIENAGPDEKEDAGIAKR